MRDRKNLKVGYKARRALSEASGATMIETAIALPIFIAFILAVIEILWFFHVKITLEFAAQQAVDLATKSVLETPVQSSACLPPDDIHDCEKFKAALLAIIDKALHTSTLVAKASTDTAAAVHLRAFKYFNQDDYSSTIWDQLQPFPDQDYGQPVDIAVVRPGEAVRYADDPDTKWVNPFRADDAGVKTAGLGWPTSETAETWEGVLSENPIAVHLEAYYTPLTPFFKSITGPLLLSVTQYGFRSSGQKGIAAPYQPSDFSTPPPKNPDSPTPVPCTGAAACCANAGYCCGRTDGICADPVANGCNPQSACNASQN